MTLFLYGVLNVFLSRFCIEYSIENDPTFMFSEDKTKHVEIYGTKMALRRVKLIIYCIYLTMILVRMNKHPNDSVLYIAIIFKITF